MKTKLKYLPNAYTRTSTADNTILYIATTPAPKRAWEFDLTNETARTFYVDDDNIEIIDPTIAPLSRTLSIPSYEELFLANQEIIPFAFNKEFTLPELTTQTINIAQPGSGIVDIFGEDTSVILTTLPVGFTDAGNGDIDIANTVGAGTYTIEYELEDSFTPNTTSATITVILE